MLSEDEGQQEENNENKSNATIIVDNQNHDVSNVTGNLGPMNTLVENVSFTID